jgi:hypothetical protein
MSDKFNIIINQKGLLLEDTSNHVSKPFESSQAVVIINASFVYDIYKKDNCSAKIAEDTK